MLDRGKKCNNINEFINIDQCKIEEDSLVSIITPAYNAEKTIIETMNSVMAQTYQNWEMIIVDDLSSDSTTFIVEKYIEQDRRIKLIKLQANSGVAYARNVAINNAKGQYIAFLDSDDTWIEDKLTLQISFMKENNIYFSFTQYRQFKIAVDNIGKLIDVPACVKYRDLLRVNSIPCSSVVLDRNVIKEVKFPQKKHEDYILWLSILKNDINAYGLKQDLMRYRVSNNSISGNKFKAAQWHWDILIKEEKIPKIEAIFYFLYYAYNAFKKHYIN